VEAAAWLPTIADVEKVTVLLPLLLLLLMLLLYWLLTCTLTAVAAAALAHAQQQWRQWVGSRVGAAKTLPANLMRNSVMTACSPTS
jgi:hypothetical protein